MFVIFSHILAFSTLFVAAISDLKTTDVPDIFGVAGVIGGVSLHAAQAYTTGSIDPLLWSIGAGTVFSLYGWGAYLLGMWGGADAFAMSVLGFAAPYSTGGPGYVHGLNLFVNIMLLGFVYSLLFAAYKAFQAGGVVAGTVERIQEQERRIALELLAAGAASAFLQAMGMSGFVYFGAMVFLVFIYRFFQVLQEDAMSVEKPVQEIEPGAVIDLEGVDISVAREENLLGRFLGRLGSGARRTGFARAGAYMERMEERMGYPEVVGVREEEIEKLRDAGVEKVDVKTGARFVPVFPAALFVTDVFGGGVLLLLALF